MHGGDRLPWVSSRGRDNFDSLAEMRWQVHVYGRVESAVAQWCAANGLPLHNFIWAAEYQNAGLERDALYLIRPDSYVGMVDTVGRPDAIANYFAMRGIALA